MGEALGPHGGNTTLQILRCLSILACGCVLAIAINFLANYDNLDAWAGVGYFAVGFTYIATALMIILSELGTVWGPAAKLAKYGIVDSHKDSIFVFVFLGFLLNSVFVSNENPADAVLVGMNFFKIKQGWSDFSRVVGGVFWGLALFHGILMCVVHKVDDVNQPTADAIRHERTQAPGTDKNPIATCLRVLGVITLIATLVATIFSFVKNCDTMSSSEVSGFSVLCYIISIGIMSVLAPLFVLFTELNGFWLASGALVKFCMCQARLHLGTFYLLFGIILTGSINWFAFMPYGYAKVPQEMGWTWYNRSCGLIMLALAVFNWAYAACHPTDDPTQPATDLLHHKDSHEAHDSGEVAATKQPAAAETKDVADKV